MSGAKSRCNPQVATAACRKGSVKFSQAHSRGDINSKRKRSRLAPLPKERKVFQPIQLRLVQFIGDDSKAPSASARFEKALNSRTQVSRSAFSRMVAKVSWRSVLTPK